MSTTWKEDRRFDEARETLDWAQREMSEMNDTIEDRDKTIETMNEQLYNETLAKEEAQERIKELEERILELEIELKKEATP